MYLVLTDREVSSALNCAVNKSVYKTTEQINCSVEWDAFIRESQRKPLDSLDSLAVAVSFLSAAIISAQYAGAHYNCYTFMLSCSIPPGNISNDVWQVTDALFYPCTAEWYNDYSAVPTARSVDRTQQVSK